MTNIKLLSWSSISNEVDRLIERHSGEIGAVYGIPTGGSIVAAMVAERMGGIALLDAPPEPGEDSVLVVDDLVDSGATFERVLGESRVPPRHDALFRKGHSPHWWAPDAQDMGEAWLAFPWENADSGPEDAVRRLLQWVGEDPTREGLIDTPSRVTAALQEMTSGYASEPKDILKTTFDEKCDEMVLVGGIRVQSMCEHHMLPFTGTAVVGYLPDHRVVGLSKLPRLVEAFSRRLQVQERLTAQVANAINDVLAPKGVGVVIRAHHECMGLRGVRQEQASMTTSSMLGAMRTDPSARTEFLALAREAL